MGGWLLDDKASFRFHSPGRGGKKFNIGRGKSSVHRPLRGNHYSIRPLSISFANGSVSREKKNTGITITKLDNLGSADNQRTEIRRRN